MARKDDPVFNVKFVQLVEKEACLWNDKHPSYNKKEAVQKAWENVSRELNDSVRNTRERWRTIRSSFLRSLKLSNTQTGRNKRKYYLAKYLQFLEPFTKPRGSQKQQQLPNTPPPPIISNGGHMVLRKPSGPVAAVANSEENTKDTTTTTDASLAESKTIEVFDSDDEPNEDDIATPLRIKVERQPLHQPQQHCKELFLAAFAQLASLGNIDWMEFADWLKCNSAIMNQLQFPQQQRQQFPQQQRQQCQLSNNNNRSNNLFGPNGATNSLPPGVSTPAPTTNVTVPVPALASIFGNPLDANISFLISLHPYMNEMNGRQCRRFRQKIVGFVDEVLDEDI